MSKVIKIATVITIAFVFNLFQSCDCTWPKVKSDFNQISVLNIDNSAALYKPAKSDTMHCEAVAFQITIQDTVKMWYADAFPRINFGFNEAKAFSCACNIEYSANQQITKIRIETLYPLSSTIPAMTDVTSHFVALRANYYTNDFLYTPMEKLYEAINGNSYCDSRPIESFYIFLRIKAENNKAQFRISAELSDNRTLTTTTNLISLL